MARNSFQLNYDEMTSIAKHFKDEGEDIMRLHSTTRQRVRDLYKEWVGEAADKFFEEMETQLLPALQRLSTALFHTQDVSNGIMKIIQGADEETVGYFKDQLSSDDFGASRFGAALNDMQSRQGADDFGAGKFGEAVPAGGGGATSDDFGAHKFGEAISGKDAAPNEPGSGQQHDSTSSQGGGGERSDQGQKDSKAAKTETTETATGGGGGGASSSEGLKGDLKGMGTGLGGVTQNAETGGGWAGGPTNMPDHVYSSGDGSPKPDDAPVPRDGQSKPGVDTGSGDSGQPQVGGAAAGAAGAAVAGGGAAKALRGRKKKISGE